VTSSTVRTRRPFLHAVGFYDSAETFVQAVAPFCQIGLDAGQPTLVRLPAPKADLLRAAVGTPDDVVYLPHDDQYATPAGAMAAVLDMVEELDTSTSMRLIGELPAMRGLSRDAWVRYEAAVNRVLAHAPIDALCPADTRVLPPSVCAEWLRCHHAVVDGDGVLRPNDQYQPPELFGTDRAEVVRDEVEDTAPDVRLVDPTASAARETMGTLAASAQLDGSARDNLLLAVSEAVSNAILHGARPVTLRAWQRPGRVVAAVHDTGPGPADPFAGLLPVPPGEKVGGLGLWITHQLCPETSLSTDDGFTLRIAAGLPPL
jgi:anti-sigma regulatory factor (Ser/Thr protein kinase)